MSRRSGGSKKIREITNDADDDAQPAPKKPRAAAPPAAAAEAATTLNDVQLKIAREFHKKKEGATDGGVIAALSIEPVEAEFAAPYLVRLLAAQGRGTAVERPCSNLMRGLVKLIVSKDLTTSQQRTALGKALTGVTAIAFLAAGAPPPKKIEEEGHVEGSVDVRKDEDVWRRYRDPTAAGLGTPGVSKQQIQEALKRLSDPKSTYAQDRGFEVRYVTDATRCATATNKVVRGYHRQRIAYADRKHSSQKQCRIADAEREEEERKAKAALAVAAKETDVAYRQGQYDYFGMTYSSVPPLPDGATDADRERLQREALEAFYGRSASPS